MKTELQIEISFEQILDLVRKLPRKQKIAISKELEKEAIETKLSQLLNTFKTDELSLDTIDEAAEKVRQKRYEKQKH